MIRAYPTISEFGIHKTEMVEEDDAFQAKQRKEIGVPKGPVEVW